MTDLPAFLNPLATIIRVEDPNQAQLLKKFCRAYGFNGTTPPRDSYQYNKQVHGTTIIEGEQGRECATVPADGIYTKEINFKIAVRTADCLPVLFVANNSAMAMAVHAGWRGLTAGILSHAVKCFASKGINPSQIYASIGPAIGRERYEVGPEVVNALFSGKTQMDTAAACVCITKGKTDRWYLDLHAAAVLSLTACGVPPTQIELIDVCTFTTSSFNSYRREGKSVGSNISWISL